MSRSVFIVRFWGPVIVLMALIFVASTDMFGGDETSSLVRPFLEWLLPGQPESLYEQLHFLIRKAGHLIGYAWLAMLTWRALRHRLGPDGNLALRPVTRGFLACVILIPALYAVTDEWHQTFTEVREGKVSDVLIDTVGAILGMASCWFLSQVRFSRLRTAEA